MKIIEVQRTGIDYKDYVKRSALETDYKTLITDDCVIVLDGKPIILYKKVDFETQLLADTLNQVKYQTTTRTSGLQTTSRVFGYQPRIPLRRDFCSSTSLAHESPKLNEIVCDYGRKLLEPYEQGFPETYKQHLQETNEKIRASWVIDKTPFTSGIINKNNPLKYHFDAGNFKDVCSCMLCLKNDVSGGYLSCPEIDIGFKLDNGTCLIFDGQGLLHGVTPITKLSPQAYRYTVVYYTLLQMWKCGELTQEIARIRNIKSERERKRLTARN